MPATSPAQAYSADGTTFLRPALILLWILSAPVLCIIYLKIEPSPDQAQFSYMGWMALQGRPFYAGSFDMNWPGGMLLHELSVRLFGPTAWSWHLLDYLLAQVATVAAALFLRRAGFLLAPMIVLVLYPALYVTAGGWMAGQRDIIAMGILIIACCAMLSRSGVERRAMFCAGALVACAVLIRPTYLSVLAGLMILETLPRSLIGQPRKLGLGARLGAIFAGFCAIIVATVIWALATGILDDWYQQSVLFTSQVYYDKPPMDMGGTLFTIFLLWWHFLSLGAAVGLILWLMRDRAIRYPLILLLGLGLSILMSYFAQRKGFGYHIAGFIPLLAMLTAVAIDQLAARGRRAMKAGSRRAFGIAAAGLAGLVFLGTGAKIADHLPLLADYLDHGIEPVAGSYEIPAEDQARMIAIIRSESTPEDRVAQYGTAYNIPYLVQRLPPHRFITPAIELMTPDFPLYDAWMEEMRGGLRATPPKFVLIIGTRLTRTDSGFAAPDGSTPALSTLLDFMGNAYRVRMQGAYGILLERDAA